MTFEQLVHLVRSSTGWMEAQFSIQDMGSGLTDALIRIERLEAQVKQLQAPPKPPPPAA